MKQLFMLLCIFGCMLGAKAQSNEDCRTKLVYRGYNKGFLITITNKTNNPRRYSVEVPTCNESGPVSSATWISKVIQPHTSTELGIESPICCGVIRVKPYALDVLVHDEPFCGDGTGLVSTGNVCNPLPVGVSKLGIQRDKKTDLVMVSFVITEATNIKRFVINVTTDGVNFKPVLFILPANVKLNVPNIVKFKIK